MNAGEIAALLMAAAALITAISNARNGKDTADKLRKQIDLAQEQNSELLKHNEYQDALLLDRETKISNLKREIEQWQGWSTKVGRTINTMHLEIGRLQQERHTKPTKTTRPLPELPDDE